jgi:GNT-I family
MVAPIVLFCYNRPTHLKKTIESLLQNELAKDSKIYIFSDGPKPNKKNDKEKVEAVRAYLNRLIGFKEIIISNSTVNKGLANSVIFGVSEVIKQYGRAIVLEDDLMVSNDFLEFMNTGLEFYKNEKKIYSISGYSFLLEKIDLSDEVFLIKRASSWGWATWVDRWEDVDWKLKDIDLFFKDANQKSNFMEAGEDTLPMLAKYRKNKIDSWAIRWTYHHFINSAFCLVPKYSKVENFGTDRSGTNFIISTDKYKTKANIKRIDFPELINENQLVTKFIKDKFKPSYIRKIINKLRLSI